MSTLFNDSTPRASFLAVFCMREMPGVVAFDYTADAIEFLESCSDIDGLAPLGVVGWDSDQQRANDVCWTYSPFIPHGMIMTSAFQGYVGCRN